MDIKYTVASCSESMVDVEATVNGSVMAVKAPGVVIELVSHDASMGHTYRITGSPEEIAKIVEDFPVGKSVTVSITPDA